MPVAALDASGACHFGRQWLEIPRPHRPPAVIIDKRYHRMLLQSLFSSRIFPAKSCSRYSPHPMPLNRSTTEEWQELDPSVRQQSAAAGSSSCCWKIVRPGAGPPHRPAGMCPNYWKQQRRPRTMPFYLRYTFSYRNGELLYGLDTRRRRKDSVDGGGGAMMTQFY